jgi:hypothetical protein
MKTANKKRALFRLLIALILSFSLLLPVPHAQALNSTFIDPGLGYLTVTASVDFAKPGDTIQINLTGRLLAGVNQSDTLTVSVYVATTSDPAHLITQGSLVLPADATQNTAAFSVAIPESAVVGGYVYLTVSDQTRMYTHVYLCLVQDPTYAELQLQVQSLQLQVQSLQSQVELVREDNNVLLYVTAGVVMIFVVAFVFIFRIVSKAIKKVKTTQEQSISKDSTVVG